MSQSHSNFVFIADTNCNHRYTKLFNISIHDSNIISIICMPQTTNQTTMMFVVICKTRVIFECLMRFLDVIIFIIFDNIVYMSANTLTQTHTQSQTHTTLHTYTDILIHCNQRTITLQIKLHRSQCLLEGVYKRV